MRWNIVQSLSGWHVKIFSSISFAFNPEYYYNSKYRYNSLLSTLKNPNYVATFPQTFWAELTRNLTKFLRCSLVHLLHKFLCEQF
eukprot:UN07524